VAESCQSPRSVASSDSHHTLDRHWGWQVEPATAAITVRDSFLGCYFAYSTDRQGTPPYEIECRIGFRSFRAKSRGEKRLLGIRNIARFLVEPWSASGGEAVASGPKPHTSRIRSAHDSPTPPRPSSCLYYFPNARVSLLRCYAAGQQQGTGGDLVVSQAPAAGRAGRCRGVALG